MDEFYRLGTGTLASIGMNEDYDIFMNRGIIVFKKFISTDLRSE